MNTAAATARTHTGPRTEEGKARSAQNARKHSLTAKHLVIRDDEREDFEALQADLTEQLEPVGPLEMLAFNRLLHNAWNLHRFRRLEASLMVNGLDPIFDDSAAKTLDRLQRYATTADRAYSRALNELRTLQTERALRRKLDPVQRAATPRLASVKQVANANFPDTVDRAAELAMQMIKGGRASLGASSFRKNAPSPVPGHSRPLAAVNSHND